MDKEKVLRKVALEMGLWSIGIDEVDVCATAEHKTTELKMVESEHFPVRVYYADGTISYKMLDGKEIVGIVFDDFVVSLKKSSSKMGWKEAKEFCENLRNGNLKWELPNINELKVISRNMNLLQEMKDVLGGDFLRRDEYWSQDEYENLSTSHYHLDLSDEQVEWNHDIHNGYACPILRLY